MVEYKKAVFRPFQDVKKVVIGIIISMIPVVNLLVSGFAVRAAKNTMEGNDELPEWSDWISLFTTGITVAAISIIYLLPAIFLFLVGLVTAYVVGSADVVTGLAGGGIAIIVAALFLFAAMFISPMAIMKYVAEGTFSSAFDVGDIAKRVFTGTYIVAWIAVTFYSIIVAAIAELIPIIGIGIAGYVIKVTVMTVFADVYAETK